MSSFQDKQRAWLDPLGFSREEADAVVGTHLRELVKNLKGVWVPGRAGEIVASEQTPRYSGNKYQYFVSVVFTDRDGNRSLPRLYGKEQLENFTVAAKDASVKPPTAKAGESRQQKQHPLHHHRQINGQPLKRQANGLGR